jgi:hypothetical protein
MLEFEPARSVEFPDPQKMRTPARLRYLTPAAFDLNNTRA